MRWAISSRSMAARVSRDIKPGVRAGNDLGRSRVGPCSCTIVTGSGSIPARLIWGVGAFGMIGLSRIDDIKKAIQLGTDAESAAFGSNSARLPLVSPTFAHGETCFGVADRSVERAFCHRTFTQHKNRRLGSWQRSGLSLGAWHGCVMTRLIRGPTSRLWFRPTCRNANPATSCSA